MLKINYKMVLMVVLSMVFSTAVFAQSKVKLTPLAVKNLVQGISSDNYGLRRSSIYYAGEYRIRESGSALISAFKKETVPANKILIAYSLYRIGDAKSFENFSELIAKEENPKVKTICAAVVEQFTEDNLLGLK
jgi:HEAT repeat protein